MRAYLADYVQGLAWYNDPANRTKAIEIISDYLKSPKEVLDFVLRHLARLLPRSEWLRAPGGDPEAGRRDGRGKADRPTH